MLRRIEAKLVRPDPRFSDERVWAVGGQASIFSWVLQMVLISGALLYRLLALGQGPGLWWDFALIVQVGYWLTVASFATNSFRAPHATAPLGASILGSIGAVVFMWLRTDLASWRCITVGLFSAPLWYVGGQWILYGLRRRIPTDERIEAARGRAIAVGGALLFWGVVASTSVRTALLLYLRDPRVFPVDVVILFLLPMALSGWLFRAWGGVTPEADVQIRAYHLHNWPLKCAGKALIGFLGSYALVHDWARALSMASAFLVASLIFTLVVWANSKERAFNEHNR
jgi:hypothetical protein